METLVDDGKIRFIGVSNLTIAQMDEARRALAGKVIVCNQVLYHLGSRGIEFSFLTESEKRGVAVVTYSPFGQGDFPSLRSRAGRVLASVAEGHGKTPRQVALNFLTRHQNVFAIPKSGRIEHVRENAGALGWSLTDEDLGVLDRAFPAPKKEMALDMI